MFVKWKLKMEKDNCIVDVEIVLYGCVYSYWLVLIGICMYCYLFLIMIGIVFFLDGCIVIFDNYLIVNFFCKIIFIVGENLFGFKLEFD